MSAQPTQAAPNLVTIEVDGKSLQVPKGSMIIQATDKAGIPIPRFCYHRKLPIAASCRQCLVEVEMGGRPMPKPQPACATPVADGMKVKTRSDLALHAQRNTLEFLLINHPMDCPICDQGGECELQDMALGFGRSVSRFTERKRTIADENIGPLVATEMTRCIHCTRCVRFLADIGGGYEFGSMDRGDRHVIGTYIGRNVDSELSGNIIDLCPVGALTNKPFQFRARAWELLARASIAYHDALGSNLWLHTRRGQVLRTVPRDNEAINECWLSDRDRYSCEGLYVEDRLQRPEVKRDGKWQVTTWEDALAVAAEALKSVAGDDLGVLVHPATTNEEGDLLMRLTQGLGTPHVDHRLRQLDFADNAVARRFGTLVEQVQEAKAVLLVGSDLRYELPLLSHRVRQATKQGAKVFAVNPASFNFNYELAVSKVVPPQALVAALLAVARAAVAEGAVAPATLAAAIQAAASEEGDHAIVAALKAGKGVVIVGEAAVNHPEASWLRALARFIAEATGAGYDELPTGANAIGLGDIGVVPGKGGLNARSMLAQPRKAYLLYGVEPPHDFADGTQVLSALRGAQQVVAFTAYASAALRETANVLLPIALLPETDGTLVNVDGNAQRVVTGAGAPGDARPGWKVLRALGGQMQFAGFEFDDIAGLREGIVQRGAQPDTALATRQPMGALTRLATWPIYRIDAVVRRSKPLNAHSLNRAPAVRLSVAEAARQGVAEGASVRVGDVTLPVVVDANVPDGTAWIEAAQELTATLPPYGAPLTLSKV
ncbi:MAG: NADH-quinone oxidoreductase subunit G [Rhodanobacter sp.]|nr:MAG: NADH-quinone oxidoreductase subunit G [Rhodanobacter sp.]TAM14684.1 MAG: NADH-quinone oxidoreductase subunit G [Rhodanobacter sp.]TAM37476.1 MAG: NADH-quinone oxidoreductase subunit G [Rhodanobacter sp.]